MSEPKILSETELRTAFNDQLDRWAHADPNPANRELAQKEIQRRKDAPRAEREANQRASRSEVAVSTAPEPEPSNDAKYIANRITSVLPNRPFDPRTEVSADAKRIVKHLWIIFVLLPIILALLYELLK